MNQLPKLTAIIVQSPETQIKCESTNMVDIAAFLAIAPAGNHHALVLDNEDGTYASTIVHKSTTKQVLFYNMKTKSDIEINVFREVFDQMINCHSFNQPTIECNQIEIPIKDDHHGSVYSHRKSSNQRRIHT